MPLPSFLTLEPIRYRAFRIRYSPATEKHGSRTIIYDTWYKNYIFLPNNDKHHDIVPRAIEYLESKGFIVKAQTCSQRDWYDILLVENFSRDIRGNNH